MAWAAESGYIDVVWAGSGQQGESFEKSPLDCVCDEAASPSRPTRPGAGQRWEWRQGVE